MGRVEGRRGVVDCVTKGLDNNRLLPPGTGPHKYKAACARRARHVGTPETTRASALPRLSSAISGYLDVYSLSETARYDHCVDTSRSPRLVSPPHAHTLPPATAYAHVKSLAAPFAIILDEQMSALDAFFGGGAASAEVDVTPYEERASPKPTTTSQVSPPLAPHAPARARCRMSLNRGLEETSIHPQISISFLTTMPPRLVRPTLFGAAGSAGRVLPSS